MRRLIGVCGLAVLLVGCGAKGVDPATSRFNPEDKAVIRVPPQPTPYDKTYMTLLPEKTEVSILEGTRVAIEKDDDKPFFQDYGVTDTDGNVDRRTVHIVVKEGEHKDKRGWIPRNRLTPGW